MKILAATISHESNTFSNIATDLNQFQQRGLFKGQEVVRRFEGTNTVCGGFLKAAAEDGLQLAPLFHASAYPSGKVTAEAFDALLDLLLEGLKKEGLGDGVLLDLHGAMVSENYDDPDGQILDAVRRLLGPDAPIAAVIDLHANISPLMVKSASALIGYKTYPHVDMAERGYEAGKLMTRLARGEVRPTAALVKPPMLPTSQNMVTGREPMKSLLSLAQEAEKDPRVLNVTVSGGFPPADVWGAGFSVVATTDDDPTLAAEIAEKIAQKAWALKEGFLGGPVSLAEAVAEAMQSHDGLVTVVDIADNPATGGPGDGPELVRLLVEKKARNCAFASIADPEVVQAAVESGVGSRISVHLGGKTDGLHGEPFFLKDAYVKIIADGRFVNRGPMATNVAVNVGRTVVLVAGGVEIIVTEQRISPIDLEMFRFVGIEPTRKSIIGLKGKGHFRASLEPISRKIIIAEGPGITGSDLSRLNFVNLRRPMFPLDDNASYEENTLRFPE